MKATREREEIKCAASLHVFLQKRYGAKAKCKDGDAEYTSELGGEEHRENAKVKEEFPAGINVVKEIKGDNDDVPKEERSSACAKDSYEYEEETDEVTGKKK